MKYWNLAWNLKICIIDYAVQLLHAMIDGYTQGPSQLRNSIDNLRASVPNYLSTNADEVNKAEAVAMFVSRYNRWNINMNINFVSSLFIVK